MADQTRLHKKQMMGYVNNNRWDSWGRWAMMGIMISVLFLIIILVFACVSLRRRRRNGLDPVYGTGWLGWKRNPSQQDYNNQAQLYNPNYGNNFGANRAFPEQPTMGQAYEIQQPQQSYQKTTG